VANKKKRNIDKRVKISVTIPPSLIRAIEAQGEIENRGRSNQICEAVRQYLANRPEA
jgi:metal-responsive CopG/Arc/MetJ family transcriptional regulator